MKETPKNYAVLSFSYSKKIVIISILILQQHEHDIKAHSNNLVIFIWLFCCKILGS